MYNCVFIPNAWKLITRLICFNHCPGIYSDKDFSTRQTRSVINVSRALLHFITVSVFDFTRLPVLSALLLIGLLSAPDSSHQSTFQCSFQTLFRLRPLCMEWLSESESESEYLLSQYKFTRKFVLRCTVSDIIKQWTNSLTTLQRLKIHETHNRLFSQHWKVNIYTSICN